MEMLELTEEESLPLPRHRFNKSSALALHQDYKNQITVDFPSPINDNCYVIRSSGYIGYLPIDENYSLQVLPKVPIINVFRI